MIKLMYNGQEIEIDDSKDDKIFEFDTITEEDDLTDTMQVPIINLEDTMKVDVQNE